MTLQLFRFSIDKQEIEKQRCDFNTARREGDRHANEHQAPIRCDCYNVPLQRWDFLGSFMGNRKFCLPDGEIRKMNREYTNMTKL